MTITAEQEQKIVEFCRHRNIVELSIFGSAVRGDFSSTSDVDVLVTFAEQTSYGLWDHAAMQEELSLIFGRNVDLLTRRSVEKSANWIRRNNILSSAVPVYAAQ